MAGRWSAGLLCLLAKVDIPRFSSLMRARGLMITSAFERISSPSWATSRSPSTIRAEANP